VVHNPTAAEGNGGRGGLKHLREGFREGVSCTVGERDRGRRYG
jgi:hypothetical protein